MGIGFQANLGRPGDSQAWKEVIGSRPVAARLALLPEPKSRWDRIGISAIGQAVVILFFLLSPLMYPQQMKTALNYQVMGLMRPVTEIPVAPVKPQVLVHPKLEVPKPVQLNPMQPHVFLTAKAVLPKPKTEELKPVELNPQLDQVKLDMQTTAPKRPKDDVKVGVIWSGSAAPATVVASLNNVQTGGFGDANGIPGKAIANKAANVNRLGSPAFPGGPEYGNGTGGNKGIRGTVVSGGFGNGTAIAPPSPPKRGTIQSAGFADEKVAAEAPKKKVPSGESAEAPVVILDKPRPEYTPEARDMKIEGDVVLDMVFLADGSIQVKRVVSGLGHGLDEAAIRAAQQIKFKAAKRDAQPVDFAARVRIEFRLAY